MSGAPFLRVAARLLLAGVLAATTGGQANGQANGQARAPQVLQSIPIGIAVTLPLPTPRGAKSDETGRPPITPRAVLKQTAGGAVGGALGILAVGAPLIAAGYAGYIRDGQEALVVALVSAGFVGGTTAGVHRVGRSDGVSANPLATAAGVVAGSVLVALSGVPLQKDDDEYREPNLLLLLPPAMGGAAGFMATRRATPRSCASGTAGCER